MRKEKAKGEDAAGAGNHFLLNCAGEGRFAEGELFGNLFEGQGLEFRGMAENIVVLNSEDGFGNRKKDGTSPGDHFFDPTGRR